MTEPKWISFSDKEPTEEGEYVFRYRNRALCTCATLQATLGCYRMYGAIEWILLPDSKERPSHLKP